MQPNNIITDIENLQWYQSTKGPQVSATVKGLTGLVIPVLMNLGIIKTGVAWIDSLIDVLCIAGFGGYALYGYVRAKKELGAKIVQLQGMISLSQPGHIGVAQPRKGNFTKGN